MQADPKGFMELQARNTRMTSDIERKLDEIDRKLQIMIENSYLVKLDLMFSVLVSFTIFGGGLLLSNFSLEGNILLIPLEAFFPVLVYTLIGEAYSILKDDVSYRFGFWLVLLSNLAFLGYLSLFASLMFLDPLPFSLSNYVLPLLGYVLILALIRWLNRSLEFFWRYIARFPSRFPNVQQSYGRETGKLLKPLMLGLVIYVVSFIALVVCSLLLAVA